MYVSEFSSPDGKTVMSSSTEGWFYQKPYTMSKTSSSLNYFVFPSMVYNVWHHFQELKVSVVPNCQHFEDWTYVLKINPFLNVCLNLLSNKIKQLTSVFMIQLWSNSGILWFNFDLTPEFFAKTRMNLKSKKSEKQTHKFRARIPQVTIQNRWVKPWFVNMNYTLRPAWRLAASWPWLCTAWRTWDNAGAISANKKTDQNKKSAGRTLLTINYLWTFYIKSKRL